MSDDDTLFDPETAPAKTAASPTGSESDEDETSEDKRRAVKNKILAIGRMSRVFALMREESERSSELRALRIETGADGADGTHLVDGAEMVKEGIHGWKEARVSDVSPPSLASLAHARRKD